MIEFSIKIQSVGNGVKLVTSSNVTMRNAHMKTTGELMAMATFCQKLAEAESTITGCGIESSQFHKMSMIAAVAAQGRGVSSS